MFEWAIKISVAAVLFTIVSYILPKSNIRNASLTALSFLFLAILMIPLKNVASELINKKYVLESEKNELISQIENNGAEAQVIKYYIERISEEVKQTLENKKYICNEINITVDENTKSENFGNVLNVVCNINLKQDDKKNTINKIEVPNIVIDKGGIRIEKEDKTEKPDMTNHEKEIKDIINELTGVDRNRIIIRWGE